MYRLAAAVLGSIICIAPVFAADRVDDLNSIDNTYYVILDPQQRTTLSAEVLSPVLAINKKMGESFEKGDVLVKLDDTIFRAKHTQASAEVERAKTQVIAKRELFADHAASLLELKEAEASLAAAESDLAIASRQVAACTILAPYPGKVVAIDFEQFELIEPGEELMEIVDDRILVAKLLVPSLLLKQLSVGNVIHVNVRETQTKEPAIITRISAVIDPSSGTIKVDAEIDNEDQRLRSGMTGTTVLPTLSRR